MLGDEGHGTSFTGTGGSIEAAAENAAGTIYERFGRETLVEIVRVQALVKNPVISEYRIVMVPTDE